MTVVERTELRTRDLDLLASLFRRQYVDHAATFRCLDPAAAEGQVRIATTGGLTAGWLAQGGIEYIARSDPAAVPTTAVVLRGNGQVTVGRHEQRLSAGDAVMVPLDQPAWAVMADAGYLTVQVPWAACAPGPRREPGSRPGPCGSSRPRPGRRRCGAPTPARRPSSTTGSSSPRPGKCTRSWSTR